MNIKRADNRPMVIHTKEKLKLHGKGMQGTKAGDKMYMEL